MSQHFQKEFWRSLGQTGLPIHGLLMMLGSLPW